MPLQANYPQPNPQQQNFQQLNVQQQAAFQRAIDTWNQTLNIPNINIQVQAYWQVNLGEDHNAMCVPNLHQNNNIWYVTALSRILEHHLGEQENQPDMFVFFSGQNNQWYTDQNAHVPPDQSDLQSIALHELCHGLGFLSLSLVVQNMGSFGNQFLINPGLPEVVRGILQEQLGELPNLNNLPSLYDTHIQRNNQNLTDINNIQQLGNALRGLTEQQYPVQLFFNPNQHQIHAPNPFLPFTSITHLDLQHFPDSLMRPIIAPGEVTRQVDQPVQQIMQALGWPLQA